MKIVVNHLTRMQHGYICVAGVDPGSGKHVRPVPESDRLRRPDTLRRGGPFDIACVVELGRTSYVGQAPELEDHRFNPSRAARHEDLTPAAFWDLLKGVAHTRLRDIFGEDLQRHGRGFAVDAGKGAASLGCLTLSKPPVPRVTRANEVRLAFNADPGGPSLKVTDLRLYDGEPAAVRLEIVAGLTWRIVQGVGVILSVGLGRPWQKPDDAVARHWLQVNNIHLEDDPVWQERSL